MYQITEKKQKVYLPIDETARCAEYIRGDYELICYDTETTGKIKGSYPVQITALKLKRINGSAYQIVDTLNVYLKPPISVPEEVVAVHGLDDAFLSDKPTEDEAFEKIKSFFGNVEDPVNGPVIFGFNSMNFDTKKIMDPMYKRCGEAGFMPAREFDAYKMAKELLVPKMMPVGEDGKHHMRLIDVASLYGITGEHFHDARTDIEVTVKVTWALYNDYANTFIAYNWLNKPRIEITGISKFNPSQYVDYVYFNVVVKDGFGNKIVNGRIHYDKRNKKFIEDEGEIFLSGNMLEFEQEAYRVMEEEKKREKEEKKKEIA